MPSQTVSRTLACGAPIECGSLPVPVDAERLTALEMRGGGEVTARVVFPLHPSAGARRPSASDSSHPCERYVRAST